MVNREQAFVWWEYLKLVLVIAAAALLGDYFLGLTGAVLFPVGLIVASLFLILIAVVVVPRYIWRNGGGGSSNNATDEG